MTIPLRSLVYIFSRVSPASERRIISERYMGLMTFIVIRKKYSSAISACLHTRLSAAIYISGSAPLSPLSPFIFK